jgi:hypothetical protein
MVTRDYKTSLCFRIYDLRVLQNNPIVGIVDFGFGVLRAFVGFSGVFHFVVGWLFWDFSHVSRITNSFSRF